MRNEYNHFSNANRLFYKALHIVVICILMCVGAMPLSAQIYSTAQGSRYEASFPTEYGATQQNAYSAHEAQANYNSYQSTVYVPFDNTMPSENTSLYQSPSNSDAGDRSNAPSNRRNLGGVGDPGNQSQESPVGEAWVMLFFAAAAAVVVFVRQRKAAVRG